MKPGDLVGSSPHTRGAHPHRQGALGADGIIPAYAGSTSPLPTMPGWRQDHPRIRGEHNACAVGFIEHGGSSPHTRGAHVDPESLTLEDRIIPAYAGSTKTERRGGRRPRDHPRIRGEHRRMPRGRLRAWGSSPHTRGALRAGVGAACRPGIIPAYAGSTAPSLPPAARVADHPRIRGEHEGRAADAGELGGSSPHTRGAPVDLVQSLVELRIIPAYAGSTRGMCPTSLPPPGSSPHTRGAPRVAWVAACEARIIPAYAGSTTPKTCACRQRKGSSPHTRGALAED